MKSLLLLLLLLLLLHYYYYYFSPPTGRAVDGNFYQPSISKSHRNSLVFQLDQQRLKFTSDRVVAQTELRKKMGQLLYLNNLAKVQIFSPYPLLMVNVLFRRGYSCFSILALDCYHWTLCELFFFVFPRHRRVMMARIQIPVQFVLNHLEYR